MNDRCNFGQFSRMARPNAQHHHLANKNVLRKGKLGLTPRVIKTGFQNQRNPSAPTFQERSLEWTWSMEEKVRKGSLDFILRIITGS